MRDRIVDAPDGGGRAETEETWLSVLEKLRDEDSGVCATGVRDDCGADSQDKGEEELTPSGERHKQ